jgi:hypothetical protein
MGLCSPAVLNEPGQSGVLLDVLRQFWPFPAQDERDDRGVVFLMTEWDVSREDLGTALGF